MLKKPSFHQINSRQSFGLFHHYTCVDVVACTTVNTTVLPGVPVERREKREEREEFFI